MLRRLRNIRWQLLVILLLNFMIILGIVMGSATANIVPASFASDTKHQTQANELKPPQCNGLNLTNVVILANGDSPTNGNDLILGTAGTDIVNGGQGNDCIVGGGGDDNQCNSWIIILCRWFPQAFLDGLDGGAGTDVIIGGSGTDACFGETTVSCELP